MTGHAPPGPVAVHRAVAPLGFLLGRWAGEGEGGYPTVDSFAYGEEITLSHVGRPFLAYAQRTWRLEDGMPSHAETGYWRCPSPGRVELVVAHPNGLVEVSEGRCEGTTLALTSTTVARTSSAKDVRALTRRLTVEGDRLDYELDMEAMGLALSLHLRAVLQRVSAPPA